MLEVTGSEFYNTYIYIITRLVGKWTSHFGPMTKK